jgi:long-chain acyl-CoA synthetase
VEASGGDIFAKRIGGSRFLWHPAARVFEGAGDRIFPVVVTGGEIAERPSGLALARAFGCGGAFRIGGRGAIAAGDQPMFETLTSGSSGGARRIWRTQASWIASFAVNARVFGIGAGARVAVLGRLVHSLALYGAVEAVHLGAELHLLDALRPDRQRAALAARRVGVLYATPAQLRLLVEAGGAGLPDLRLVLVGGSKLDMGLRAGVAAMAPAADLREFYGAAETSFITLAGPETPPASVGAAYPQVQIEVRRPDAAGFGEIWVQSPYLFAGYAGADIGGAQVAAGWVSVGEIGRLIDGQLYLAGRAGRMVTVADQNVFPEEIEAFLATLAAVQRVAVLPRKDGLRGVVMVAVVQGDVASEVAILEAGRRQFGPLKAPRTVIWRKDWPVLASGKTDLVTLAREAGL